MVIYILTNNTLKTWQTAPPWIYDFSEIEQVYHLTCQLFFYNVNITVAQFLGNECVNCYLCEN